MAGGSGTRLWPMSRRALPKQLIPFVGGKSLLRVAMERQEGLLPEANRLVCAGRSHEAAVRETLGLGEEQYFGEPCGRDTVNAVGYVAAVIARRDPEAVIAVFAADHTIEPVDGFREIVAAGFEFVERSERTLLTFGVAPTEASTGYGYLELGERLGESVCRVDRFREKPDERTARQFFAAGPGAYLWNSGMFVWRAADLLECIRRYHPENHAGLMRIADAWDRPQRDEVLEDVYPSLEKISVDFAVMEPASHDPDITVAAIPMPLEWLDVGSWSSFAESCPRDENGNAVSGCRTAFLQSSGSMAASSDPDHLVALIGCQDLVVVHTPDATLVCPKDKVQYVKEMYGKVAESFGDTLT
jgi:mannose-1-phosphate guanylyltransferase